MMVQENTLGATLSPFMEKISIVKRRQLNNENDFRWAKGLPVKPEDPTGDIEMVLNQDLTPGDPKFIPLDSLERETSKILRGLSIDRPTLEQGRIVFTFRLKTDETVKLLTMEQVTQMLQISRSFLIRQVRNKTIRSYKFGRLRRFLLNDVIEYLSSSQDQGDVRTKTKRNGNGLISKLDH
jgi:excisionase family DNA binding protein